MYGLKEPTTFFFVFAADRTDAACKDGARVDAIYPPEWLNLYIMPLGETVLRRYLSN